MSKKRSSSPESGNARDGVASWPVSILPRNACFPGKAAANPCTPKGSLYRSGVLPRNRKSRYDPIRRPHPPCFLSPSLLHSSLAGTGKWSPTAGPGRTNGPACRLPHPGDLTGSCLVSLAYIADSVAQEPTGDWNRSPECGRHWTGPTGAARVRSNGDLLLLLLLLPPCIRQPAVLRKPPRAYPSTGSTRLVRLVALAHHRPLAHHRSLCSLRAGCPRLGSPKDTVGT